MISLIIKLIKNDKLFIYLCYNFFSFFIKKIKNTIYKYDKHICVWCKYLT